MLSAIDKELDLLLTGPIRSLDLPSKHPHYFRYVFKEEYDKNFSTDIIEIYDKEPEDQSRGDDNSFYNIRRYAAVLPLVVGIQMIPVPFILSTGALAYMYLCTTAIRHLNALSVIKEVSGHYLYQLMVDLLGPNDNATVNNMPHLPQLGVHTVFHTKRVEFEKRPKFLISWTS